MKFIQPLDLDEIAVHVGGQLRAPSEKKVEGINALENAKSNEITYCLDKYARLLSTCQAGVVILSPAIESKWQGPCIVVSDPYLAYARLTQLCVPTPTAMGIHPTATLHPSAKIDKTASIGPHVVIGKNVSVGKDSLIDAGCVLYDNVIVGDACHLYAKVVVYADTVIHNRVIIHANAVLGSDGFGFAPEKGTWVKIAQLGNVIIEDDVEIGAGTTIDRGALKSTHIGRGVKLDNQIQIAHNVEIGAHTAIAAQTGVAGSTKIGKFCQIGGGTGIGGHLVLGDHTYITGMSMVTRSITKPGLYSSGIPARPNAVWRRNVACFQRLGLRNKQDKDEE